MLWLLSRKGPSGFSASSTAEEVTQGIDGSGLTAIVTGASSGIGAETTRVLALRGVHVVMGVKNTNSGKRVKETIVNEIPRAKLDALELDLSSLSSVRKFASDFSASGIPLNILINNAGQATSFKLSKDNIELNFATNYLANESGREARIVNVSSNAHHFSYPGGIRFDKLNDPSGFTTFTSYAQSKLANVLHANELARRFKEDGVNITANSLHPGMIVTNLYRQSNIVSVLTNKIGKFLLRNVQQGAATTCYVALHPQVKGTSGAYFINSNLAKASSKARDEDLAKKLWDFSMNLINNKK